MAASHPTFSLLAVIALIALSSTPPTTAASCTNELVSFSTCLPYAAAPPNNTTSSVTAKCCDSYLHIVTAGKGSCLCNAVEDPLILGFPLNASRILSLSSLCPPPQRNASVLSLQAICIAVEAPPPVPTAAGPRQQNDSNPSLIATGPAAPPLTADPAPGTSGSSLPPPDLQHSGTSEASSATKSEVTLLASCLRALLAPLVFVEQSYILDFSFILLISSIHFSSDF